MQKTKVIKNGVSEDLLQEHFDKEILKKHAVHWEKFALCVARIDERKNILNLVKALKDTNINLLISGTAATEPANRPDLRDEGSLHCSERY